LARLSLQAAVTSGRIIASDTDIDDELVERGINAVFTVAPGVDVC
jgi:hypothetical protein